MAKKKMEAVVDETADVAVEETVSIIEPVEVAETSSVALDDIVEINGRTYRKIVDEIGSTFLEPLA